MDFNYVFFSGHFTCGCTLYKKMRHFCDIGLHPLLDYNDLTPIAMLFRQSWQNIYILHAFDFSYNNFGYIVTLPKQRLSLVPENILFF